MLGKALLRAPRPPRANCRAWQNGAVSPRRALCCVALAEVTGLQTAAYEHCAPGGGALFNRLLQLSQRFPKVCQHTAARNYGNNGHVVCSLALCLPCERCENFTL